jgi:flagellar biosynthetic protein FlhB
MAEQPAADRTEQPTPKRLQKARNKGQVAHSRELPAVVVLMALVGTVALLAPSLLQWLISQMKEGMCGNVAAFSSEKALISFMNTKIVDSILLISPILAALSVASLVGCVTVSGLNFAPEAVKLDWEFINPASGLQKLINVRSLVNLLVSVLKLVGITIIVWLYLRDRLEELAALRWAWSEQILVGICGIILGLMIRVGIGLAVIAIAEAFYQKWKYTEDLKMTRQDVKRERKDTEGSPEVKGRIRRIQLQMAMKRISAEVPKATVVLVNPAHVAVALRYETDTMDAPVVVAKGADHLAEKIREIARAYGVPVIRRPELARAMYATVKPGSAIPETLYVAVAEVLALIYRLRNNRV